MQRRKVDVRGRHLQVPRHAAVLAEEAAELLLLALARLARRRVRVPCAHRLVRQERGAGRRGERRAGLRPHLLLEARGGLGRRGRVHGVAHRADLVGVPAARRGHQLHGRAALAGGEAVRGGHAHRRHVVVRDLHRREAAQLQLRRVHRALTHGRAQQAAVRRALAGVQRKVRLRARAQRQPVRRLCGEHLAGAVRVVQREDGVGAGLTHLERCVGRAQPRGALDGRAARLGLHAVAHGPGRVAREPQRERGGAALGHREAAALPGVGRQEAHRGARAAHVHAQVPRGEPPRAALAVPHADEADGRRAACGERLGRERHIEAVGGRADAADVVLDGRAAVGAHRVGEVPGARAREGHVRMRLRAAAARHARRVAMVRRKRGAGQRVHHGGERGAVQRDVGVVRVLQRVEPVGDGPLGAGPELELVARLLPDHAHLPLGALSGALHLVQQAERRLALQH